MRTDYGSEKLCSDKSLNTVAWFPGSSGCSQ